MFPFDDVIMYIENWDKYGRFCDFAHSNSYEYEDDNYIYYEINPQKSLFFTN